MTTTGYGDVSINYISDALFVSVITIIAKLLYSFIVGFYSSISSTAAVRQVYAKQDFNGLQVHSYVASSSTVTCMLSRVCTNFSNFSEYSCKNSLRQFLFSMAITDV